MDKAWSVRVARWAGERFSHEKRMRELQYEIDRHWSPPSTLHSSKGSVYDYYYPTPSQVPIMPNSVQNSTLQNFPPNTWHGQFIPPIHNTQGYAPMQPVQSSYAGSNYPTPVIPPLQMDSSSSIVDPVISMQPVQHPPLVVMSRYGSRSRSRSVSRAREDSRERSTVIQIPRPSNELSWSYPDHYPDIPPPAAPTVINLPAEFEFEFDPIKVMDLRFLSGGGNPMPDLLFDCRGVEFKYWMRFISVCNLPFLLRNMFLSDFFRKHLAPGRGKFLYTCGDLILQGK